MKCPHCEAKIDFWSSGPSRVRNGCCPECSGEVKISFSGKRLALLLPISLGIPPAMGFWGVNPHLVALAGLLGLNLLFFGSVQFSNAAKS